MERDEAAVISELEVDGSKRRGGEGRKQHLKLSNRFLELLIERGS